MFHLRKFLSLEYPRTLIMGLLVIAMFACSLPMTHADHGDHHGDVAELIIDTTSPDNQSETDDRSTHQHVGLNEHNPGHLSNLFFGFNLNADSEQWHFVKAQPLRQDFLYALERPPRA